jgi:hypothetical protein
MADALWWTKGAANHWLCRVPPEARFTLKVFPKGDGRWSWEVFSGTTPDPMATGIVNSLGAAKAATERFLKSAGYL